MHFAVASWLSLRCLMKMGPEVSDIQVKPMYTGIYNNGMHFVSYMLFPPQFAVFEHMNLYPLLAVSWCQSTLS